jgi:hypothetical protein
MTGSPNRLPHTVSIPWIFFTTIDAAIPGTVPSPVTVSGRTGNAPANLRVNLGHQAQRAWPPDIDLPAPDGGAYPLLTPKESDDSPNLAARFLIRFAPSGDPLPLESHPRAPTAWHRSRRTCTPTVSIATSMSVLPASPA